MVARTLAAAIALAAAACGSDSDDGKGPRGPDTGTVTMHFSVSNGVKQNPTLTEELDGAVYGACFPTKNVTVLGPTEGTVSVADAHVEYVDLRTAATSAESWTSGPIAVGTYTFLGMLDVDDNGAESRDPDSGDPVTLPLTNQFDILADQVTAIDVVFELVY